MTFLALDPAKWMHMAEVDSTNVRLLAGSYASGTILTADKQTAGRGRHGRPWLDLNKSTFIFSAYVELEAGTQSALYLPLACGTALLAAIEKAVRELKGQAPGPAARYCLKWPNDVWAFQDGARGKLAGILVESEIKGHVMRTVLGIGLNWRGVPQNIDKPALSLFGPEAPEPGVFTRFLAPELNDRLKELFSSGAGAILADYRSHDCTSGRQVMHAGTRYTSAGIDDEGGLVLVDLDGRTTVIRDTAGELELTEPMAENT
ncbi:MAG: biotin--[acetyl-CoA-carboxylase] ligase [Spirochaetia bacterium]|nr:biotin--[acetyl-CoA-carboxylase] ligase [Spirochaetia bacterium]